jgi:hypothetical protein
MFLFRIENKFIKKIQMELQKTKKSLGETIYQTLQKFYPNTNLGITIEDVRGILEKAQITKKNIKKEEISKIIKILRTHIEQALVSKNPVVKEDEVRRFPEMEKINNSMSQLNMEYYNNLEKMRQQDITVNNKKEMPTLEDRQKIKAEIVNYYVIMESQSRNQEKYGNPSEYMVEFTTNRDEEENFNIQIPRDLSNIVSVELQECIINDNLFNADYYINLEVDEIGGNISSNNSSLKNTFVRLTDFKVYENHIGKYRVYKIPEDSLKIFKPEKNFSSISIRLKNSKGESLIFNREQDGVEPLLNSFKFKFSKKEKSMSNSLFM